MKNVVSAQADATVHSFRQFRISTDAGCLFRCVSIRAGLGFVGIRLIQSRKAVGHIGVDGIEPVHHILVNRFNDFILGFISTDAGRRFLGQSSIQVGYILTDSLICFDDGSVLYRCISLAHIILGSLVFQIFLHLGDAGIQGRIADFTGCFFRCVSICAGLGFVGIRCIQSSESICHVLINGIDTLYQIFIDLLDHLVLSCISADAGSRFIIQALSQCGHIFADFLIRFHDTGILYRCISLCGKGLICTICGVHRLRLLRSSARIRLLDRHGVRGPGVIVVDGCEQHGGYGCSCGGCAQAGVHCFRVGFGVLRHDDVAVLCLAPNDFENPVHKMTSPFELLMIR